MPNPRCIGLKGRFMKENGKSSGILVAGGVLAGLMSSLCCVGPLILTILGLSGAATLSKLDAFRIPLIGIVGVLFTVAGWMLYRQRNACDPDSSCSKPGTWKRMFTIYVCSLVVVIVFITSPYWIAWIWE
ncbi:MAG: mercury transporter [Proteobacteria bacterium]|nr:MAG: mercury transporter [Pseudomonadota bacterium]